MDELGILDYPGYNYTFLELGDEPRLVAFTTDQPSLFDDWMSKHPEYECTIAPGKRDLPDYDFPDYLIPDSLIKKENKPNAAKPTSKAEGYWRRGGVKISKDIKKSPVVYFVRSGPYVKIGTTKN